MVHDLPPLASCAFLILTARRLPVVQLRAIRIGLAPAVVCAAVLWAGPIVGGAAAVLAGLADARFFCRDHRSRVSVALSTLPMLLACLAAALAGVGPGAASARPGASATLDASYWLRATLPLAAFVAAYAVGVRCIEDRLRAGGNRALRDGRTMRLWITAAGFLAIVPFVPVAAAAGPWALAPFSALLVIVGLLIRRAFDVSRLRRRLSASQALGIASLQDTATAEPSALLLQFLRLSDSLVHAERGLVWMVDDENGEIVPAVGLPDMGEFAGLRARLGEGLVGAAAERSRPMIVSDAAHTLRRGENEPAEDSWLLYPILSQQKVLGVAHWTRPAATPFTADDAEQLEGLVPHVGVAVESLRERSRARDLAATDGLTGLFNHRRIDELLREEMRRAQRYNRPLSVLMLDLDSFKSVNDNFGHVKGDLMLKTVARVIRTGVRTVDRVGRYGGEEFIVVMPETHKDDAYLLAERMRAAVEEKGYIVVAGEEIHRTVSVGVASYPEDGLNPQEVIERADEALYRSKDAGRNRVTWA